MMTLVTDTTQICNHSEEIILPKLEENETVHIEDNLGTTANSQVETTDRVPSLPSDVRTSLSGVIKTADLTGGPNNYIDGPCKQLITAEMNLLNIELEQFKNDLRARALRRRYRIPISLQVPEEMEDATSREKSQMRHRTQRMDRKNFTSGFKTD